MRGSGEATSAVRTRSEIWGGEQWQEMLKNRYLGRVEIASWPRTENVGL